MAIFFLYAAPVETKRRKGSNGSEFPAKMRLSTRYENYGKYVIIHERSSKFVQTLLCMNDQLIEGGAETGEGEKDGERERGREQKLPRNRNRERIVISFCLFFDEGFVWRGNIENEHYKRTEGRTEERTR